MELPFQCGRYECVEYLGGGMADVYRARDTVIGRTVAVKVLREEGCSDRDTRARFLREAKIAGNIVHDNIVHMYDFGEIEGRPYIVMEYLWGDDLRAAIDKKKVGDVRYRLHVALGIARAFEHIHSLGIVHRDLKPENISVDATGKVKLVDFGIAKSKDLSLTRAGFTLGTPMYMAPEQVMGEEITPLVDIYAYGLVLYELFTGVRPVTGATVGEVFDKILKQPIDLKPLAESGAGPRIVRLVERMTRKSPEERPQSFREIREEMEALQAQWESGPMEEAPVRRARSEQPRRPTGARFSLKGLPAWSVPAAAVGVILAVVLLVAVYRKGGEGPVEPTAGTAAPEGLVLIPAGVFPFGRDGSTVELPGFYIDRGEVTVAEYGKFAAATSRPAPVGAPEMPVARITIDDASAYARWAGKRLPTSQEWEKAARGPKGFVYPWGGGHDPAKAVVADNAAMARRGPAPAGSLPEGASPYGVLHLAGNVREFVQEFVTPSPEQVARYASLLAPPPTAEESWCLVRGGSFDEPLPKDAALAVDAVPARYAAASIGFRCARDAP